MEQQRFQTNRLYCFNNDSPIIYKLFIVKENNMNYQQIKELEKKEIEELTESCDLIWAFSNKQFEEAKKENEKYISIGCGGYMPKSNIQKFNDGMDKIEQNKKERLEEAKEEAEKAILYELCNYECFITYDLKNVFDIFKGVYSEDKIREVFNKNKNKIYA